MSKRGTFRSLFGVIENAERIADFLLLFSLLRDDLRFPDCFYFPARFHARAKGTRHETENSGNRAKPFQKTILICHNDAPTDDFIIAFDNLRNRFNIKIVFIFQNPRR